MGQKERIRIILINSLLLGVTLFCSPPLSHATTPDTDAYRLDRKPFINPRIIQDLTAWISDGGDQVVAINLPDAQLSNRYFCNVQIKNLKSGYPYVSWIDETKHYTNPVEFGYQYIGKSANGIYVVVTSDGGGGSEIDDDLLLLRFESGVGYDIDWDTGVVTRQSRYLIEKISQVYLGNKWGGTITVQGNQLTINRTSSGPAGTPNGPLKTIIDLSKISSRP